MCCFGSGMTSDRPLSTYAWHLHTVVTHSGCKRMRVQTHTVARTHPHILFIRISLWCVIAFMLCRKKMWTFNDRMILPLHKSGFQVFVTLVFLMISSFSLSLSFSITCCDWAKWIHNICVVIVNWYKRTRHLCDLSPQMPLQSMMFVLWFFTVTNVCGICSKFALAIQL